MSGDVHPVIVFPIKRYLRGLIRVTKRQQRRGQTSFWRCRVVRTLRAEKAFPDEAARTKLDRGVHSSTGRCSVLETSCEMAGKGSGSRVIHVARERLVNIPRMWSTTSLLYVSSKKDGRWTNLHLIRPQSSKNELHNEASAISQS